jgi:hypothetical protein
MAAQQRRRMAASAATADTSDTSAIKFIAGHRKHNPRSSITGSSDHRTCHEGVLQGKVDKTLEGNQTGLT